MTFPQGPEPGEAARNCRCSLVPAPFEVSAPENWTPEQLEAFEAAFGAFMRSDLARRHIASAQVQVAGPPGVPRFAVVEIEWAGGSIRQKFGPWMIAPDDSHMPAISGFVNGWSQGSGIEPEQVTLTIGDESVAEGATPLYRDQPGAGPR